MRLLEAPPAAPPDPGCAFLNLDKATGPTSFQATRALARLWGQARAGHAGTLDPEARGVLPVALGEATRFLPYLDLGIKIYRVEARLGCRTTTGDASGEAVEDAPVPSDVAARLERVRGQFLGTIPQVPPMHAAVHHEGRRLYEWARRGLVVERSARPVRVDELDLEAVEGASVRLRVVCGPGTYVRVLVEDLARAAGTLGHVVRLERLAVGPFRIDEAWSLERLRDASPQERRRSLLPVSFGLRAGPGLVLDPDEVLALTRGRVLDGRGLGTGGIVPLHTTAGVFLGLGALDSEGVLRVLRLRPTGAVAAP